MWVSWLYDKRWLPESVHDEAFADKTLTKFIKWASQKTSWFSVKKQTKSILPSPLLLVVLGIGLYLRECYAVQFQSHDPDQEIGSEVPLHVSASCLSTRLVENDLEPLLRELCDYFAKLTAEDMFAYGSHCHRRIVPRRPIGPMNGRQSS